MKKQIDSIYSAENMQDFSGGIMVEKRAMKETSYPLHWHSFLELELIIDGNAQMSLNGTEYKIEPGVLYFMRPTDFHEINCPGQLLYYNISISEELIDSELYYALTSGGRDLIIKPQPELFNRIITLVRQLKTELTSGDEYHSLSISNLLGLLLVCLLRALKPQSNINKKHGAPIRNALNYLNSHFRENPSLKTTAEVVGLSPSYFSMCFHKSVKKTYKQYVSDLKLVHAKKLLISGNDSVTDICYMSGFGSFSQFSREFKQKYGQSPCALRKENR